MSGYPFWQGERLRRNPYEERMMDELFRSSDVFAPQQRDRFLEPGRRSERLLDPDRRSERREYRSSPPPILTVRAPSEELRRSLPPQERRGTFSSFLRSSATPPPRASGRRIDRFSSLFGDLEQPTQRSHERLQYDPVGPPRDPFTRYSTVADRPYGGGRPPRDPFVPGGDMYNFERERGHRHRSIEPDYSRCEEPERRRHEYYRSRIGESWGVAGFQNYEGRRRHERRMHRERRHERDYANDGCLSDF